MRSVSTEPVKGGGGGLQSLLQIHCALSSNFDIPLLHGSGAIASQKSAYIIGHRKFFFECELCEHHYRRGLLYSFDLCICMATFTLLLLSLLMAKDAIDTLFTQTYLSSEVQTTCQCLERWQTLHVDYMYTPTVTIMLCSM